MKPHQKLSITRAAVEFGCSKETIRRGLRGLGLEIGAGQTFTIRQVHRALAGDYKLARARREAAEAERAERENRIADGDLIDRALCEKKIAELWTLPTIQALNSLPSICDVQCNPTAPEVARQALTRWAEETKRQIREPLEALLSGGEAK